MHSTRSNFTERFFNLLRYEGREEIKSNLAQISENFDLYVVGGAIRDTILCREFNDLDLVSPVQPDKIAHQLGEKLGWAVINLSTEFGIYRVAHRGITIDISQLRGKAIEDDLQERDYTINALAIPLRDLLRGQAYLIDPCSGYADLKSGLLRVIAEKNLQEDPLRILRGYRLMAQDYGQLEGKTRGMLTRNAYLLGRCAVQRVLTELEYILLSKKAWEAFVCLDEDFILEVLFPEIITCKGVPQPGFHHLDVWGHLLESLRWAEVILGDPKGYLRIEPPEELLKDKDLVIATKLAALFHDLGKGYTFQLTGERIVFYGHEVLSGALVEQIAERLRLKKDLAYRLKLLVKSHMRPCHLLREFEEGRLTLRAKRNLLRDVPYLWELFVVAMADSLASRGPEKEPDYEDRLRRFFSHLFDFKAELERVERRERLITGRDLIELGFRPGPLFREILEAVELKILEGLLKDKEEALEFVLKTYQGFRSCKNKEDKLS